MFANRWIVLASALLVLSGSNGIAKAQNLQGDESPVGSPKIRRDVVYGHKDGLALTMDVFHPSGPKNDAAVIYMVSGGWYSRWSPPEELMGFFGPYLQKGYTMVAVRHGSSPRYGIPDAVSDVRRAIRYLRVNADDLGFDPDRMGAMGMSAGGHLSLVLATTGDDGQPNAKDRVLRASSRVTAVAAMVPPTDLTVCVWGAEESLPSYRGFPALDLAVEEAAKFSPKLHVTKDDAPALVISGTLDDLVPARHGEWIAEEYKKVGVEHRLLLLEADHGLTGKQTKALKAVADWFDEQLKPSPTQQ